MLEKKKSLRELTSIRIGGIARLLATPTNIQELKEYIKIARDMDVFVIGRGSNTIMGDFDGIVIRTSRFQELSVKEMRNTFCIYAGAGISLMTLVRIANELNLEGIYKLDGFPASVGGAVSMNAGAFGCEFSEFIKSVDFIGWDGELHRINKEELSFSYRNSQFPELGLVIGVSLEFKKANTSVAQESLKIKTKRLSSQPRGVLTCGSTFKNPPGDFAGRLLELSGLKGFKLGNVGFSSKHANFLINFGNASFSEASEIIVLAREKVFENFNVLLEEEVKLIASNSNSRW
ncbi:MAG: UDP-N-acetylmuramate dehydrogenase [Aquificaceae bacterium]|nr:UDP-N-acetylmuramate dehydrogenase [Aquificaceae bacterium]